MERTVQDKHDHDERAEEGVTPVGYSYDHDAPEYKPRLAGEHPYRTTTRFMRDIEGRLMRDVEGYLVPMAHEAPGRMLSAVLHCNKHAAAERAKKERKAMAKQTRRINKRQDLGDPNCVRSRDEDFPLLAVLRRDKMEEAIKAVLGYRQLVALCAADPLKGVAYGNNEEIGLSVEFVSGDMNGVEEVNREHKAGFKLSLSGGEIQYSGSVRKSKGAYSLPAKRKVALKYDDGAEAPTGKTESLHIKLTEDAILDRIDKLPLLMRIRSALGPLVDSFEDAVLGGMTLTKIGQSRGNNGPAAPIAGKSLVMEGISVVEPFLVTKKHASANDNYLIERRKIA